MAKRKGKQQQEENVQLGPQVAEGEFVFGVAHIFASFNDTFVHVTDLSGRYCYILLVRLINWCIWYWNVESGSHKDRSVTKFYALNPNLNPKTYVLIKR